MNSPRPAPSKFSLRVRYGVALMLTCAAIASGRVGVETVGQDSAEFVVLLVAAVLTSVWLMVYRTGLLPARPYPTHVGLFAATYFVVAGFGNGLALIPGVSIVFWPPAGVFLAVLLLNPTRLWPIYILGGCLAEIACNEIWFHNPLPFALLFFAANTLEAVTAALLLRRFLGRNFRIETPADAGIFIFLGAMVAPVVGATIIATADALRGRHPFLIAWPLTWLGDGSGLLVSTPLAISAIIAWRGRARIDRKLAHEAILIGVALIAVGTLAFWNWLPTALLTLPLVLWAATRFQIAGAALAVSVVTLMTAFYTMTGMGEFAGSRQDEHERIVMLQVFLGITAISALLTATLSSQRQKAFQALERLNRDLELRIVERTHDVRKAEERLNLALAAAHAGAWEYNLTTREVFWCPEMHVLYGLPPEYEPPTWKDFTELIHQEDRERATLERASATTHDGPFSIEFRIVKHDGTVCWILSTGVVEGEIARGIDQDISTRKRFEENLRRSEERFSERLSMAASAAGFGLLHVDFEKEQVYLSPELNAIVGYPKEHDFGLLPGTVPPFIHPDDVESLTSHWEKLQLTDCGDDAVVHEHRIVRPDGEVRWVRLQTKTICHRLNDSFRPSQIMGTLLDITSQRDFEQSLHDARCAAEQANAAKSMFVANISHEIRTPMTSILGYTELLEGHVSNPQAKRYLQTILRNGVYLQEIINDLLDLSKLEAGKFQVSSERFALERLIEDVRISMQARAEEKQLRLSVVYETQIPPFIESDSKRLKQILINLIGNAIKFTATGEVRLGVHFLDDGSRSTLRLEVSDTGIGMTEEQVQNLFQPFAQGDATIARRFGGTGLGLDISRRLAKMLGGDITVSSELDRGSVFTVSIAISGLGDFDLMNPQLPDLEESEAAKFQSSRLNGKKVLCVDDRRDIRFLVAAILAKEEADTIEAEDGSVALEKVTKAIQSGDAPHAILLDMQMPIMDGFETAKCLRECGYYGPIIALTADAMESEMRRCIDSGCDDYLSKPINSGMLIDKILTTLNRKMSQF